MHHNFNEVSQQTESAAHAVGNMMLTVVGAIVSAVSFISASETQSLIGWLIGCTSGIVATASGIMAFRYYYYATKKIKKESK